MTATLGSTPITAPGWTGKPRSGLALIDCDVHQIISKQEDLYPYLSRLYRERVEDQGMLLPGSGYFNVPKRAARSDLNTGCDANMADHNIHTIGSQYELLRSQHLDMWNVDYALLTGASVYPASVIPDPDFGAALCRAFNDWTMDTWASRDERFIVAISVSANDPQRAAEEIYRMAGHPQVRAIMLPTGSRMPYGNRFYHPIWQACAETGLVVGIHPGAEGAGMAGSPTGVGYPTYYIEVRMARPQMAMAHVVSFIAEGVFEKYPTLKLLVDECDQFWLVGLMWHMDADWKSLREQTPWVRRLPSEYVLEHVRVGSQPMLEPERREQFFQMLDAMHAERTLVYSSDWPHWDWDDPATTFPRMPEHLHQRVFSDNARELFGL
ncbi:MAG: amidohydrolase [Chloroflexi bacterium]|nr:MAG: amidohydrolase [Chloroflexota bacterium]